MQRLTLKENNGYENSIQNYGLQNISQYFENKNISGIPDMCPHLGEGGISWGSDCYRVTFNVIKSWILANSGKCFWSEWPARHSPPHPIAGAHRAGHPWSGTDATDGDRACGCNEAGVQPRQVRCSTCLPHPSQNKLNLVNHNKESDKWKIKVSLLQDIDKERCIQMPAKDLHDCVGGSCSVEVERRQETRVVS